MDDYDQIVSLGYVCNVVSLISALNKRTCAYPFDRVGTPMWAVYKLIENDFENFLKTENIITRPLFEKSNVNFVYDSLYYVRLISNIPDANPSAIKYIQERIIERIKRFQELLNSDKKVLFIRSQEPESHPRLGKRIIFPEYQKEYSFDEYYYLKMFVNLLKQKYPNLKFKILYLNEKGLFVDDNIIGIPIGLNDWNNVLVGKLMKEHLEKYKLFLDQNL